MDKYYCWLWILLFCSFLGCNQDIVFKHSINIDNAAWSYDNRLTFEFNIQDTTGLYSIELEVDHEMSYEYQNVYVKIHTLFPDSSKKEDIVSLELADKNGLWNGKCSNNNCLVSIPLQDKTYFQKTGAYKIVIEQFMRLDDLTGIDRIKLVVRSIDS